MSTGKRLAKRSIIGTRVCVKGEDGIYYSGVINAVKTPGNSCATPQSDTRYSVRFDPVSASAPPFKREYRDVELIGPGFQTMQGIHLLAGQKVYITYNGREVSGEVIYHNQIEDEVLLTISPPGTEGGLEIKKRLEDVRLTECRKSARLQDQDTDYSRLADMAGDRRRLSSHNIDVPPVYGSRKRRPSSSQDDAKEDLMDECTAALVLMHLSCSPHSPSGWVEQLSPAASLSDACSWRSGTPSPPLSESAPNWLSASDEGIVLDDDFDELPKKKKPTEENWSVWTKQGLNKGRSVALGGMTTGFFAEIIEWPYLEEPGGAYKVPGHADIEGIGRTDNSAKTRLVYQCRWPGCHVTTTTCNSIEAHVRNAHLGPKNDGGDGDEGMEGDDHEEEFYYTELEVGVTSPPPTISHREMARPPHEGGIFMDHEYQRSFGQGNMSQVAGPISIPKTNFSWPVSAAISPSSSQKQIKLSVSAPIAKLPSSPSRRVRGDTKKCRKVYGMEHRELWCTQCKWKKACTRFGD